MACRLYLKTKQGDLLNFGKGSTELRKMWYISPSSLSTYLYISLVVEKWFINSILIYVVLVIGVLYWFCKESTRDRED